MSSRCPRNRTTSPRPSRSTIRSSSDDEEPFRPAIRTSSRGWVSRSDEAASTRYRWPFWNSCRPTAMTTSSSFEIPSPRRIEASRRGTAAEAIGIPTTLDHRDPRGVESHVAHRPISDRVRDRVEVIRQHPRGDHVDRTDGRQRCPPNPGILETDGRIGRVHQTREDDGTHPIDARRPTTLAAKIVVDQVGCLVSDDAGNWSSWESVLPRRILTSTPERMTSS